MKDITIKSVPKWVNNGIKLCIYILLNLIIMSEKLECEINYK